MNVAKLKLEFRAGAIILSPDWRMTYLIYAILTFLVLLWNFGVIPKSRKQSKIWLDQGTLSIWGVKGAGPLVLASIVIGDSTAAFWTFSRTFIEASGNYSDWQLSGFWIVIRVFGLFGGFSGSLIEKKGLVFSYKLGCWLIASATIILAFFPGIL